MLKFSMLLQAIDRVTAPVKRIQASWKGMGGTIRKTAQDVMSGSRSLEHFERRARRLRSVAMGRTFQALGDSARRATQYVTTLIGKLKLAERAGRGLKGIAGWAGNTLAGIAKWGGAAAAGGGVFAMFDMFTTASKFEQFQIMLENMEGSSAAAKRSFAWVKDFGQKTPYELEQVMEAFVQLKAYGIDPMAGSLMSIGDAASGMSKPLMQGVEAMADAITGEYERLKEFGIRASKSGDKVSFTYRKAGKDITRTVKATGSEVEKALSGIFSDRFGGMMNRQSQTMSGMISNLKDLWSNFLVTIADAGIFDFVKGKLQGLLTQINAWAKDGTLQAWAETISDKLKAAWEWAEKFTSDGGWGNLKTNIENVGNAIVTVANAINQAANALGYLKDINDGLNAGSGPVSRSQAISNKWWERWNRGEAPQSVPKSIPNPAAPAWSPKAPARAPKIGAANDTKVGGLIRVQVEAKPGTSVRTAALQSDNARVPLQVNLGRVMAGAA